MTSTTGMTMRSLTNNRFYGRDKTKLNIGETSKGPVHLQRIESNYNNHYDDDNNNNKIAA